ncbi:hypothetical protein [Phytohabitans rumicis]|uniref:Uncharacterized protein n=1 Tax=Phytohabitans rumicis TaxID=1076125 RepID=A0A6V8L4L7_9ACTN|nr:hypothetical protein [Phytohabitans rumicis]GFJ90500.1 hypothetical protein Prum_041420 [Phytohabitans rumicis]
MREIATRLRAAEEMAERAAVTCQHAELKGRRFRAGVIGGLELTAESLHAAVEVIEPAPTVSRRMMASSVLITFLHVVACVAVLLAVPDPSRPLVLAVALGGTGVLAKLVTGLVVTAWDWRDARALDSAAVDEPSDIRGTIVELRTEIDAISADLDPDRDGAHVKISQKIESALIWLDSAERASR